MDFGRRDFLALSASSIVAPPTPANGIVLRPEDFGARGDGSTNDTSAFRHLSSEVNRRGGGTIVLRRGRTYLVGSQSSSAGGWQPSPILELSALKAPLTIEGNGARLIAQPGLHFGTFDRRSGKPVRHQLPYGGPSDLAYAYHGMIVVRDCLGPVEIRNLELNGNLGELEIGGGYGDTGWQIPGTGLLLVGNRAEEVVEGVYTHDHGQDGAMFIGNIRRLGRSRISQLVSRRNGRQGLSITGGRGYDLTDCEFGENARGKVQSAPAAGVDIEAESGAIEDIAFTRCTFLDNAGCGFVADSGDSRNLRFERCRFIGTTSWSAWPNKPECMFSNCTFVGSVAHAFADPDPRRAAHFVGCSFTDDPALSPSRKVYGNGPIVNLAVSDNVLFDRCSFRLIGQGVLPWSWRATYRDCRMNQRSAEVGMPKGRYLGRTTIEAHVDLYGSMIQGTVILNGKPVPHGPVGVAPW
jgi:hypothetical protein